VVSRTAEVVAEMGEVVTRLAVVTHAGFNEVNAKIDALVDAQMRAEEHLTRTEVTLSQSIAQTNENHARTEATLSQSIAQTNENHARTEATLSQSIAQTNEHLNRLITKVDRYLSGR